MLLPLVLLMFLPKLMNAADPDAQKVITQKSESIGSLKQLIFHLFH